MREDYEQAKARYGAFHAVAREPRDERGRIPPEALALLSRRMRLVARAAAAADHWLAKNARQGP